FVGLDGTGLKPIVEHEADTVFYATPRFDPTGNILFVHRRAALVRNGAFVGNDDQIQRIDLRTGERKTIIKDGADPALSPDGRSIVYVHVTDGLGDGLWTAGADGANQKPFLKGRDSFWYLQTPRFAPNGQSIAFSAAGHTVARVAGGGPRAHLGVPSDLFLTGADGSNLRSVGQTGDDVTPAWSPDSTRIAWVATGGFFVIDLATKQINAVRQGGDFFFGDLLWLR
ncbi:MAG: hypothetical protein FJ034_09165, partial [Chloroflexi bacterium]|nr:hypothetical protein [Chloroflexota bacterium]